MVEDSLDEVIRAERQPSGGREMGIKTRLILCLMLSCVFLSACSSNPAETVELKHYALDSLDGVITGKGVEIDKGISADGKGSLRVTATQPTTVMLFETGDIDIENAKLIYRAKLRTEKVDGKVYLEMWCRFPGKGEFFSRALQAPLTGTNEWTAQETPFFFKKGENPDNVRLNLVVNGTGTVWIDDIRLVKGPVN